MDLKNRPNSFQIMFDAAINVWKKNTVYGDILQVYSLQINRLWSN